MTQPPQSGPWGAQPPQQPGNWQGYPGGQPGPQGPWNPQQQWPTPTPAPQKKGPLKWILGATALIAVIAVTAVVAVSCAGGNGTNNGGGGTPTSGSKSDIASANDTGPVSVITDDPSCAPWRPINDTLANSLKNGWDQRDTSLPASAWTPETQSVYQAAAQAFRNSADQTVPLIKVTTHRVMRELYQQYVAYLRLFADRISTYTPRDNHLIAAGVTAGMVLNDICQAISFRSAAARGPLVTTTQQSTQNSEIGDINNPTPLFTSADAVCADWKAAIDQLSSDPAYVAWSKEDSSIPVSDWTPQFKAENDAIKPIFTHTSDVFEKLGSQSSNPVVSDLGALAAQYGRAFVQGIPTYSSADIYLFNVFRHAPGVVNSACLATGGS